MLVSSESSLCVFILHAFNRPKTVCISSNMESRELKSREKWKFAAYTDLTYCMMVATSVVVNLNDAIKSQENKLSSLSLSSLVYSIVHL